MRLVVLGDSHVAALAQGHQKLGGKPPSAFADGITFLKLFDGPDSIRPFFRAHEDHIAFIDEKAAALVREGLGRPTLAGPDPDTVFAFCLGVMTTLIVRLPDWRRPHPPADPDSFLPHAPAGAAAYTRDKGRLRRLVSEGVVRAITLHHHRHALAFAAEARRLGLKHLIVSSPPLRHDERAMVKFEASPLVIAEVDRIARAAMVEAFTQNGTPVALPPDEVYQDGDRSRFLRADLRRIAGNDSHHGSPLFGALMLKQVLKQAKRVARG